MNRRQKNRMHGGTWPSFNWCQQIEHIRKITKAPEKLWRHSRQVNTIQLYFNVKILIKMELWLYNIYKKNVTSHLTCPSIILTFLSLQMKFINNLCIFNLQIEFTQSQFVCHHFSSQAFGTQHSKALILVKFLRSKYIYCNFVHPDIFL